MSHQNAPWSKNTRNIWFLLVLAASTISVITLLSPFLYVLLFAGVFVIVTWPVYAWILKRVGDRRMLAAILTAVILAITIFGPFAGLVFAFVQQGVAVAKTGMDFVNDGKFNSWVTWVTDTPRDELLAVLPTWLSDLIPVDLDIGKMVAGPLQEAAIATLNIAGNTIPGVLNSTLNLGIDSILFAGTVLSLYVEAPSLLRLFRNLSPLEDRYESKLFEVFQESANNLVVGAVATAIIQAIVAGIGYWLFGVERALFFAIVTGVFGFVPLVGTLIVWVPLCIMVGVTDGPLWAVLLALWSMILTGQVDNVTRPLFMRGSTNVHPMLVFLAIFGGMAWFGVPGVLIGPVLMAFFLALYKIYCDDFLAEPALEPAAAISAPVSLPDLPPPPMEMTPNVRIPTSPPVP